MLNQEGKFVAEAALDAIAGAQERITDPRARLVGVQVTLVVQTPTGLRIVSKTVERRRD